MIILDTNVVSEPTKPHGDTALLAWLDAQEAETLYLTTPSLAELLVGIALLPEGQRKHRLNTGFFDLINRLFGNRILPFDRKAAEIYAPMISRARARGQAISRGDGQIAAIALAHDFSVATRDISPFRAAGVTVINPWNL